MFEPNRCPGCGATLPSDAPAGLCPLCLLRHGLGSEEPEPSRHEELDGRASNGESGPLDSAQEFVRLPRVLLRDAEASEVRRPVSSEVSGPALGCDRYQILGEIARGGMGAVLKGRDPELGRDLAIKVLLEKHRAHPEFVRRFVEEAQIGGQLQHPGIVPVYELGQFGDLLPYFAMKLVEGRTLADLLAARGDPAPELARFLDIFEQVCQTMAYAHARGVIHRDLKPANIMVGAFGEVQVMDWGLAKVLARVDTADEESARLNRETQFVQTARHGSDLGGSQAGSVLGTPAYMAPEQARGELDLVDERADVFGLGAILCEILTGQPLYRGALAGYGEVRDRAARADLGEALARLEACGAEPELVALARHCLALLPARRPRDAGEVASALTTYRRSMRERLRRAELSSVASRAKADGEKKRRRLAVGLAAAIVGLLATVGGGGAWLIQERQARAARVDLLLSDAKLLKTQAEAAVDDPLKWATAREAAHHAFQLLEDARDPSTRRNVTALAAKVEEEAEAYAADARLLDQLAEIREATDEVPPAQTDDAYASAFRSAGLDPENRSPEETTRAITSRPAKVALGIATALDSWADLRRYRGDCDGAARLTKVARAADPDDWRGRLRTALIECRSEVRLAALRDLARSAAGGDLAPASLMLLGSALLRAGDPTTAEAVSRTAQRRHPTDASLALLLGQSLEKLARRPEAIRYYMMARASRPRSAHLLAHALDLDGEADEAIAVFRDLIRLSPTNARHLVCFGKVLRSRGHAREANEAFDSAIDVGREAIRLQPDDPLLRTIMGIALGERGRLDEAVAQYDEAIRLEPAAASAHSHFGRARYQQGRLDDAIAELREAIRLRPNDHTTRISLAGALNSRGRTDEAVSELREAIRLQPDHHAAHFNLGVVLFRQARVDDALAEFREAIRLKPDLAAAHSEAGAILCDFKRDYDAAIAEFREAIRLKPDDVIAHYGLGNALFNHGKPREALDQYREALRLKPGDAEIHEALGFTLTALARYGPAIAEFREAIRLKPDVASAHYKLAGALHSEGRNGEAMAEYRATLRIEPRFAEAHCNLAGLLKEQGQYAESLAEYERGHELGSKRADWRYPSDSWVEQLRRLVRLDAKFEATLRGEAAPADAIERLELAEVAHTRGLDVMAARLMGEALEARPELAEDVEGGYRYNAACVAAMAGCGNGKDEPRPDEAAKTAFRRRALDWLKADLAIWSRTLANLPSGARSGSQHRLEHARHDPDLAVVRESDALDKLPEAERAEWRALWAEVDAALVRSRADSPGERPTPRVAPP